jgi:pseudouridine-5'-phosphate glycosidase
MCTLPFFMTTLNSTFSLSPEVALARSAHHPIVALESTVITHGLPNPENLALAQGMETEVRANGAIPATIALMNGKIRVGLSKEQLRTLANAEQVRKISVRDIAPALVQNAFGGTTVAGTLFAAEKAGIRVFATGGIGGVHPSPRFDISADLIQLAQAPVIVVCAGAKAILDLPATLEYLETMSVPVIGYQTDRLPAFYVRDSGLPVSARADSAQEIAEIARKHWALGMRSAILVTVPAPEVVALEKEDVDQAIEQALTEAEAQNIRGQAVTPFLLGRVSELTERKSLKANLGLLRNNARIAAQIAVAYHRNSDLTA